MPARTVQRPAELRLDKEVAFKRVGLTLGIFVALLVAWPLVGYGYRPVYRGVSTAVFNLLGTNIQLDAVAHDGTGAISRGTPQMDTVFELRHKKLGGPPARVPASVFYQGYLSTALLLALILGATGGPWKFRRNVAIWSLVLLHVLLGARLGFAVLGTLSEVNIDGEPLLGRSKLVNYTVWRMKGFLWDLPVPASLIPPIILWGFLTYFRKTPIAQPKSA